MVRSTLVSTVSTLEHSQSRPFPAHLVEMRGRGGLHRQGQLDKLLSGMTSFLHASSSHEGVEVGAADGDQARPVPAQMWYGVSPVPVQMWPG